MATWPRLPAELADAMRAELSCSPPARHGKAWLLTRPDDIEAVLRDHEAVAFIAARDPDLRAARVGLSPQVKLAVRARIAATTHDWTDIDAFVESAWIGLRQRLSRGDECDLIGGLVDPLVAEGARRLLGIGHADEWSDPGVCELGRELVESLMEGRAVARPMRQRVAELAKSLAWATGLVPADGQAAVRALCAGAVEAPRAAMGLVLARLAALALIDWPTADGTGDYIGELLREATPVRATVVVAPQRLLAGTQTAESERVTGDARRVTGAETAYDYVADDEDARRVVVGCSFEAVNRRPRARAVASELDETADATFGLGRFTCPGERLAHKLTTALVESSRRELGTLGPIEVVRATTRTTPIHRSVESLVVRRAV